MELQRPKVATIVLVFKDGKVLLGRRLGDDVVKGMFGTPGGHIENGEMILESALREVREETALEVENLEFVGVTTHRETPPVHYVIVVLKADWKSGEPQVCEADKCESWQWYDLDHLPEPITPGSRKAIESYKTGVQLID